MQHRTNGSGNICHIVRLGTPAVQDAPTHKQARNMDIVWIPCSVGSSLAAVIIVVTWFQYNLNTSAALAVNRQGIWISYGFHAPWVVPLLL